MPKKRAHSNSRSLDSSIVGASKPLPTSDLPSLRDVCAYIRLLNEGGRDIDFSCFTKVAEDIIGIYAKASTSLVVWEKFAIANKIKRKYNRLLYFQQSNSPTNPLRKKFDIELDSLFEVLKCQCKMQKDTNDVIQLNCQCPRTDRIPPEEVEFLYTQRHRDTKLPLLQIGKIDIPSTKKMKRKENLKQRQEERELEHAQNKQKEKEDEKKWREEQLSECLKSEEKRDTNDDPCVSFNLRGKLKNFK